MRKKHSETSLLHHSNSGFSRYDEDPSVGMVSSVEVFDVNSVPRQLSMNGNNPEKNRAIRVSLIGNIFLLFIKIMVSYQSGSLAFVASAVNSLLDLVSQSIIFCAMRGNENVDERVWP